MGFVASVAMETARPEVPSSRRSDGAAAGTDTGIEALARVCIMLLQSWRGSTKRGRGGPAKRKQRSTRDAGAQVLLRRSVRVTW